MIQNERILLSTASRVGSVGTMVTLTDGSPLQGSGETHELLPYWQRQGAARESVSPSQLSQAWVVNSKTDVDRGAIFLIPRERERLRV
jgi:hypothetical protein